MQQSYRQLPLIFEPRERYTFDALIAGRNRLAIDLVRRMAAGDGEKQILVWAGRGFGKSHLLQAACNYAAQSKLTACYLPAKELLDSPVQVFEGLEQLDMVCIDDVDVMMSAMQWEEALFDLINRVRDAAGRILLAAGMSPETCPIRLADLRSRLSWGPVFHLQELDDGDKIKAMKQRAQQSGLEMADNVANYLLTHYPRALFDLFEHLDRLDRASMELQRRLTIPFVKSVLEAEREQS